MRCRVLLLVVAMLLVPLVLTGVPAAAASPLLNVASASINGRVETILTDAEGLTLYYFTAESVDSQACTQECLQVWRPLLSSGSEEVMVALPGAIVVVPTAGGEQVSYNGHLLYRFSGDSAPGQVNGEGVRGPGGWWVVATPDLSPSSAHGSPSGAY